MLLEVLDMPEAQAALVELLRDTRLHAVSANWEVQVHAVECTKAKTKTKMYCAKTLPKSWQALQRLTATLRPWLQLALLALRTMS